MQKPFIYTRIFRYLRTYDHGFWGKLEKSLIRYAYFEEENPIEFTNWDERRWHWPFYSEPREDLYIIIILIAKMTKTKIMWGEYLDLEDNQVKEHLTVIGEKNRVIICCHILNYLVEGILRFEDYVKKHDWGCGQFLGFSSRKVYARSITEKKLHSVTSLTVLNKPEDLSYKARLENYIMGQYKLDYKKYGQEQNAYWNAVSRIPYTNRMML